MVIHIYNILQLLIIIQNANPLGNVNIKTALPNIQDYTVLLSFGTSKIIPFKIIIIIKPWTCSYLR